MDAAAQVHAAFVPVRRAAELGGEGVALAAWSPANDVCAVVTSDGQLAVHRMNWQQLWAVAPEAPVTALAWRPDGKLLATGHADGALAVWDVETGGGGEPVARHARAHFAPVTALDWSLTPAAAHIDHDDDRWWCSGGGDNGDGGGSGNGDAPARRRFSAAATAATAAAYEDRQPRLFPADGLVLVNARGGAPNTSISKEDPYAELFRGAPPPLPRGARDAAAAAAAAAATWEVSGPPAGGAASAAAASSSSSSPPLDLLCAADRRGCMSAWVAAGRVQIGDVAGLAPRVTAGGGGGGGGEDDDGQDALAAPPPPPPPPPTLVALSTTADQSACVSVAWHPPAAGREQGDESAAALTTTIAAANGLVAAPLAARPLRAARREVRHWARLHWRLRGLLESAGLALRSASREWASASSTLRKRLLDELAEALAAHSADVPMEGGGDDDGDLAAAAGGGGGDNNSHHHDPRADLMLLLAAGTAGPGVHAWLTGSLGESGVQRAARCVDAALERVHALLLHACLPALERAAFVLGELRGLAAAAGGRGRAALLGLQAESLEPLEAAAVRAIVRAEQVRLATGRLAASHRALFTWLLRTARQLESASAAAAAGTAAADNGGDPAAANRPPPEPPAGPDAALADVLLPFLEEGGPLEADPLAPELGQLADAPFDARQRRAARRWLHGGGGGWGGSGAPSGENNEEEDLGPEAVVDRVLRLLYPPARAGGAAASAAAAAAAAAGLGGDGDDGGSGTGPAALSLAGQVAALAEACEEALAAPQASVSARLTVGRPVALAPARCFSLAAAGEQQQQQPAPPPHVSVAPAGAGDGGVRGAQEEAAAEAGPNNDDDDDDGQDDARARGLGDGVVICVVVPAAGLAAIRPKEEHEEEEHEEEQTDGVLVVRARAVPAGAAAARGSSGGSGRSGGGGGTPASDPLELHLTAVLVCGDPGARIVDAAPYKDGQLAVVSCSCSSSSPAAAAGARGATGGLPPPPPPPVLALLDLSSAPFVAVVQPTPTGGGASAGGSRTALEACLAQGAVVDAADLAAAGCVRAARLAGFAAAVAPLAVSRARGLALVLSDMQRLAVLDVDADEEQEEEEEEEAEE